MNKKQQAKVNMWLEEAEENRDMVQEFLKNLYQIHNHNVGNTTSTLNDEGILIRIIESEVSVQTKLMALEYYTQAQIIKARASLIESIIYDMTGRM